MLAPNGESESSGASPDSALLRYITFFCANPAASPACQSAKNVGYGQIIHAREVSQRESRHVNQAHSDVEIPAGHHLPADLPAAFYGHTNRLSDPLR
jgi:hypothetical protein